MRSSVCNQLTAAELRVVVIGLQREEAVGLDQSETTSKSGQQRIRRIFASILRQL